MSASPKPCCTISSAFWCCEYHAQEHEAERQRLEAISHFRAAEIRRQDRLLGHGCAGSPRELDEGEQLRTLCDADGVLVDFVGLVLRYVERNTGMRPQREAIDRWDCFAAVNMSDHWPYFREWCDSGECRTAPEMLGAREFYAELRRLAEVRVCTTPMTVSWLGQRAAWLEDFGVPLAEQYQMHDKHALAGHYDVLIDDKVENCEAFEAAGGKAFCIAAAYNADVRTARGTHTECLAWVRALAAARRAV